MNKKPRKKAAKVSKSPPVKKAKEDPEKKAKEEEEAKALADKEEAEKKEKEAIRAKEQRKREKEEKKKVKLQLPELIAMQARLNINLISSKIQMKEFEEWSNFVNPNQPPDPTNLPVINAYLSSLRCDRSNENLTSLLDLTLILLKFIDELEKQRCMLENVVLNVQTKRMQRDIEKLFIEKIDAATYNLLLEAKSKAPHDGDFVVCEKNPRFTFCVWANVSKNPRVKSFEFEEKSIFFEINPFLNRLSCCVRIIFLDLDIVSSHVVRVRSDDDEVALANSVTVSLGSVTSIGSKRSTYDPKIIANAMGLDLEAINKEKQKNFPKIFIHEAKPSVVRDQTMIHRDAGEDGEAEEVDEADEDEDLNLHRYHLVTPPVDEAVIEENPDKYFDMHCYHTVGGIFMLQLFSLPYQPKVVHNWTIQMLVEPAQMVPIKYEGKFTPDIPFSVADAEIRRVNAQTPLMITFKLPEEVHFFSSPIPALYDFQEEKWQKTGFHDKVYNETTRQISFKISKFGTMALMQESQINMPYHFFTTYPTAHHNGLRMVITGAHTEVEFYIRENMICLARVDGVPELAGLLNVFMPLCTLIKKMKYGGVNFFPFLTTAKCAPIAEKKLGTLERLYRQMALISSLVAFKNSRWSAEVNDNEKIVFQANHMYDPNKLNAEEEPWSLICVTKKQARRLKMTENSETFSEEFVPEGFQSNLYHLYLNYIGKQQMERFRDTSPLFIQAVFELFRATNPLVYCAAV